MLESLFACLGFRGMSQIEVRGGRNPKIIKSSENGNVTFIRVYDRVDGFDLFLDFAIVNDTILPLFDEYKLKRQMWLIDVPDRYVEVKLRIYNRETHIKVIIINDLYIEFEYYKLIISLKDADSNPDDVFVE